MFTVALVLFLIAEFSNQNLGFHSVTLPAVRAINLRHVLKSAVRQNLSAEQAASRQSKASGVLNPSASTAAPAPKKRPIYVSDPSKSVICHTFSAGRLGNHLFEYASILGIAETTNKTFFFFNDEELQKVLKHPPVQESSLLMRDRCRHAERLRDSRGCQYDRRLINLEPGKDYVIGDYLQSWLYFDVTRDAVREAVTFADDIVRNATRVLNYLKLQFPNTTFVGVHVRRGDLVTNWKQLSPQGYLTASPEFFQRAMTYFRRRCSRVAFVVLGEDRKWSVEHIAPVDNDVVVLEPNSPAVDMQILSMTDHMIRTVGTYGWWAVFKMAGRPTVVVLKEFVKPNSFIGSCYSANAVDYMLPGWIAM